jgi:hypothetical protein
VTMSSKKTKTQNRLGVVLILFVVLSILAISGGFFYATMMRVEISSLTVFLLDVTDELTPAQKGKIERIIEKKIEDSPKNSIFAIYKVGSTEDELLKPIVVGRSLIASEKHFRPTLLESLTTSRRRELKKRQVELIEPFKKALEDELTGPESQESPIFESIQSVVLTLFELPEFQNVSKSLVLFSDLMQNTETINFYSRIPTYQELINNQAFRDANSNLDGVEVTICILNAPSSDTIKKLKTLYEMIIHHQGGELISIE